LEPPPYPPGGGTQLATTNSPAICLFAAVSFPSCHGTIVFVLFSWWQSPSDKKPVLIYNSTKHFRRGTREVIDIQVCAGTFRHFEQVFGVEIVSNTTTALLAVDLSFENESVSQYETFSIRGFQMKTP
jgi:hypothetical protein